MTSVSSSQVTPNVGDLLGVVSSSHKGVNVCIQRGIGFKSTNG